MILLEAFTPSANAVAHNIGLSALVALIPLALFFVLLGVFKVATQWCAIASLVAAIIVAVVAFHMPLGLTLNSGLEGAVNGFYPILFIVIMAVWLYNLTETSGRSKDVQAVFSAIGKGDLRVQAILIGFSFCGLLEGLAGFGAPVAISCAMLFALGIKPIKAALAGMVGNSVTVGFGAMAIPVTTIGKNVTNFTANTHNATDAAQVIGATMGRIDPFVAIFVPFLVLFIVDGFRGIKQVWPVALVAGLGMSAGYFVGANFVNYTLAALIAALLSFALVALLMQVWHPKTPEDQASAPAEKIGASRAFLGLFPYLLVVVLIGITKLVKPLTDLLATSPFKVVFAWPGLGSGIQTVHKNGSTSLVTENPQIMAVGGKAAQGSIQFSLDWASNPGTWLFITGIIVAIVYSATSSNGMFEYTFGRGIKTLGKTFYNLRWTILTIAVIMALAYVMNFSAQTYAIGNALAKTGTFFAFLSPLVGWLGTAVTGSATSSAALFGGLQYSAANAANIQPSLLLGVNSLGGGLGKIVSPQNLSIAAAAIEEPGSESKLLAKGAVYSGILILWLAIVTFAAHSAFTFLIKAF